METVDNGSRQSNITSLQPDETEYYEHESFDVKIDSDKRGNRNTLKEVWNYRDMILLMVRRDFISGYKQTLLGPLWAVINPVVSALITGVVFGNLAGLSPSGIPTFLFYMSAQMVWGLFSGCLGTTSNTFINNAGIMGKVYFPRFAIQIVGVLSNFISFIIQVALFICFYIGYTVSGYHLGLNLTALLAPVYVIHLAVLAIGVGSILSALTTKYRDLVILISYGITFWMYISPIVYDFDIVPKAFQWLYLLNPVTPVILHIRYALFTHGTTHWGFYLISVAVTIILFFIGHRIFSRVEKTFLDTI